MNFYPTWQTAVSLPQAPTLMHMGYGMGGISSYFLKLALPFIERSLVLLFNKSLGTASFPDSRKTARVTPLFKDGE